MLGNASSVWDGSPGKRPPIWVTAHLQYPVIHHSRLQTQSGGWDQHTGILYPDEGRERYHDPPRGTQTHGPETGRPQQETMEAKKDCASTPETDVIQRSPLPSQIVRGNNSALDWPSWIPAVQPQMLCCCQGSKVFSNKRRSPSICFLCPGDGFSATIRAAQARS